MRSLVLAFVVLICGSWLVAQEKAFSLSPTAAGQRSIVSLGGTWEVAYYTDPQIQAKKPLPDRTEFIKDLSRAANLKWGSVKVPHTYLGGQGPTGWGHTAFYRTQVNIPAEMAGRSFVLRLPSFSMIASVIVNGQFCGGSRTPYAIYDCDITKAAKPGGMNEVVVVIKDVWYALTTADKDAWGMTVPANLFTGHSQGVTMSCDFPVATRPEAGILETPVLIAAGPVYTADVFAIPSVKNKTLGLEIMLANPAAKDVQVSVENSILPAGGQKAEKTFATQSATVPAGKDATVEVSEPWADAKLWWPDTPQLYTVVTTIKADGQVLDTKQTTFGFREWEWAGNNFKLNGIRWNMHADTFPGTGDPKQSIALMKKHGQGMWRFWGTSWNGLDQQQTLDFMDANGMPVRRSGVFDGEFASYNWWDRNPKLWENWRNQLAAQVKGERNHPSIFIWSMENEITFINSRNLGKLQSSDPEMKKAAAMVMEMDPTRPVMVDGGNTLLDNSLPVNGVHYIDAPWNMLPDAAYTLDWIYSTKTPWTVAKDKPILLGEAFFARGNAPGEFAQVSGEEAFLGRGGAREGVDLLTKMYSEGYRFSGINPHYWLYEGELSYYNSWQPVAVLVKEWDRGFVSGSQVKRSFGVFNDRSAAAKKIDVTFELRQGGKAVDTKRQSFDVPAGEFVSGEVTLTTPKVAQRTPGEFVITASVAGKQIWQDAKPVAYFPATAPPSAAVAGAKVAVLDPSGKVTAYLQKRGVQFSTITGLDSLPQTAGVLVVGPGAMTDAQAKSDALRTFAGKGGRVLVLEQKQPLSGDALPGSETGKEEGRITFAQALSHPVFAGLSQDDLAFWAPNHVTYRNPYRKLPSGAASLVQCGRSLSETAIAAVPVSNGLLLLSQMTVGEKLESSPAAAVLFDNMLRCCAEYRLIERTAAIVMDENLPQAKLLKGMGLRTQQATDLNSALNGGAEIIIASASPENVKALASNSDKIRSFTSKGGWIMLWDLDEKGLADFNALVGVNHMIRPFEVERVTLPKVRDQLITGLTARDITMEGAAMYDYAGDKFAAGDVFTNVVDYDEVGPFCQLPDPVSYFKMEDPKPGFDHWPRNIFNGFTTEDSWKYVLSINLEKKQSTSIPMALPAGREETMTRFSVQFNALYRKVTKFRLVFDGDEKTALIFDARPANDRQDYPIAPARKFKTVTLELLEWTDHATPVVGVDNVWIYVQRDDAFRQKVVPLLNIGAIVKYPMGEGGIVLNDLRITDSAKDTNAQATIAKKRNIVQTILHNMGAVFETK